MGLDVCTVWYFPSIAENLTYCCELACVTRDMYLHDMKYTKGHVAYVTGGQWHPNDKEKVGFHVNRRGVNKRFTN